MNAKSAAKKTMRTLDQRSRLAASAGPAGAAIAPPAYGIDVVDRGAHEGGPEDRHTPVQTEALVNRTGLPDHLKAGVENLSGYAMDDVHVHYNSEKPAQLQSYAYTQGTDIHVASGQRRHLPHEAWHVVQQKQGRVKPTTQVKREVQVNDDETLEHEADVMGNRASHSIYYDEAKANHLPLKTNESSSGPASPAIQMAKWIIRQGVRVRVEDDYALQPGEYSAEVPDFRRTEQPMYESGDAQAGIVPYGRRAGSPLRRPNTADHLNRAVRYDPRLTNEYQLDRRGDRASGGFDKLKAKAADTYDSAKKANPFRDPTPGENFHARDERRNETTMDTVWRNAKNVATLGANKALNILPVAGQVQDAASANRHRKGRDQAADVAADPNNHPLANSLAAGVASGQNRRMIDKTVDAGTGLLGAVARVATMGADPGLVGKIAKAGVSVAIAGGRSGLNALSDQSKDSRLAAVDNPEQLRALPEADPPYAEAMVDYLAHPMSVQQEIRFNQDMQRPDTAQPHNLKPSITASQVAPLENGRQAMAAKVGPENLEKLKEAKEKKKWQS